MCDRNWKTIMEAGEPIFNLFSERVGKDRTESGKNILFMFQNITSKCTHFTISSWNRTPHKHHVYTHCQQCRKWFGLPSVFCFSFLIILLTKSGRDAPGHNPGCALQKSWTRRVSVFCQSHKWTGRRSIMTVMILLWINHLEEAELPLAFPPQAINNRKANTASTINTCTRVKHTHVFNLWVPLSRWGHRFLHWFLYILITRATGWNYYSSFVLFISWI